MKIELHPSLPSQAILGPRVGPPSLEGDLPSAPVGDGPDPTRVQVVLVPIAKATFPADDPTATPLAAGEALLLTDERFPGDDDNPMRREHDLAVWKPRADVVVLGDPAPPTPPTGDSTLADGTWTETVRVGATSMSDVFPIVGRVHAFTFGWQSRVDDTPGADARLDHAGDYGTDPPGFDFDPEHRLPVGFNNRFANGGDYRGGVRPTFTHLAPATTVEVETRADYNVPFVGLQTVVEVRRLHLPVAFPRATLGLLDGCDQPTATEVPMAADTVVFDKDTGRFAVTWRGVWDFASLAADRYRTLRIEGGP